MARLRGLSVFGIVSLTLGALGQSACSDSNVIAASDPSHGGGGNGGKGSGDGGPSGGTDAGTGSGTLAVGDACEADGTDQCRPGLACTSGKCALSHEAEAGSPCVAAGECQEGLQCALGRCAAEGDGAEGDGCGLDTDCKSGLRCGIVGFAAHCVAEGSADIGQPCSLAADCLAGLTCAPGAPAVDAGGGGDAACAPIPKTGPTAGIPFGLPTPPALACDKRSTGKVVAYFDVPGAAGSDPDADFFRLPFPNDVRIDGGKINLSGFPTPGVGFLGFDPVKTFIDAITANEHGFSTYPTVLFRFSGEIDFDTLRNVNGKNPVQFLDITDPKATRNGGASWNYSGQGGKYVCHDWLAVRRGTGWPLESSRTYAAFITTDARDSNGLPVTRSDQLATLLGAAIPSDAAMKHAHEAYAPFRAYLAAEKVDPATILDVAVFTTSPVRGPMEGLAALVAKEPVPTASAWVKCGAGVTSPCPQAEGDRACGATNPDYDEYHALVTLPIFQKGTAPYVDAGGDIDSSGPVRSEEVCAAITVPKGAAPAAGFPVAVFAHGTGGSFRSHVRPEVAGALAKADPPMAVLGYDQVQHGPRRGASTASPNVLFFNFKNTAAARGNPLQGAADVLSIGRFVKGLGAASGGADAGAGAPFGLDGSNVVFFGHSQGSMHGSLALPYTDDYRAAVLSGNGAGMTHALLTKTAPDNIAAAIPFALGGDFDGLKLFGGETHPVLTLVQQWIDPADPVNFGAALTFDRPAGIAAKSVFQTYGLGDTYSPPVTMEAYATSAQLEVAAHDPSVTKPDPISDFEEKPVPLAGNFESGAATVGVREYQNAAGKDGHFVVFDVATANADVVRFLSTAAGGKPPQIGE